MATLIRNVRVIDPHCGVDLVDDVFIDRDEITIAPTAKEFSNIIHGDGCILAPGLIDLHVHFREPGFVHKESIHTGIKAALKGGVTSALVMPNTRPPLDQPKHVAFQLAQARRSSGFDLMVAACASADLAGITATNIGALKHAGVKAVTDDGKPILPKALMEDVLRACRRYDLVCMQHAEDTCVSRGAPMHHGRVSEKLGLKGQPRSAETALVERDILSAQRIGARYHVLHISCKESLNVIARAQQDGAQVSCEVTPHHLMLCDADVIGLDTFKKMNPPLRTREDARALIDALNDKTIAAVASDHAPHTLKEKRAAFDDAPFGVVGLESALLILLTLVKKGKLSLTRAIESMTVGPATILREQHRIGSMLAETNLKNAVLFDPNAKGIFSKRDLAGRSFNSPFFGMELYGRVLATFLHGDIVYRSAP